MLISQSNKQDLGQDSTVRSPPNYGKYYRREQRIQHLNEIAFRDYEQAFDSI